MNKLNSKSAVSSRQSAGKSNAFLPTAICQLLTISVLLLTANCLLPTSLNALGTVAGTTIIDLGNTVTINYQNSNLTDLPSVVGSGSLAGNVSAVYGFYLSSGMPADQSVSKSSTAKYVYQFQNRSNTAVTSTFTESGFTYVGDYGTAWTHALTSPGGSFGIDAIQITTYNVTTTITARNGSKGAGALSFTITGSNFGVYTGFNSTSYGGVGSYSDSVTTSILAPDVRVLSKTLKVIMAPTANGYAGHDNDPVPGATIEYAILIMNVGDYASTTTDVTEKVPANSIFLNIPAGSDILESSAVLDALNDVDYDTVGAGTMNLAEPVNSYVDRQSIKGLRFRISSVAAGASKLLKYRVTVRN